MKTKEPGMRQNNSNTALINSALTNITKPLNILVEIKEICMCWVDLCYVRKKY